MRHRVHRQQLEWSCQKSSLVVRKREQGFRCEHVATGEEARLGTCSIISKIPTALLDLGRVTVILGVAHVEEVIREMTLNAIIDTWGPKNSMH